MTPRTLRPWWLGRTFQWLLPGAAATDGTTAPAAPEPGGAGTSAPRRGTTPLDPKTPPKPKAQDVPAPAPEPPTP